MKVTRARPKTVRQATPRGVTGQARPTSRWRGALLRWAMRALLSVLVVGAGVGLIVFGRELWDGLMHQPVEQVKVEGNFEQLSREQATRLISEAIDKQYVELNLSRLKDRLEAHPWVERAIVSRALSSALEVKLIEQVPIALWGDVGFLNQRGEVIHTPDTQRLTDLPRLSGREAQSEKIMQQYQDLSRMLRSRSLGISRLWVDSLGTWRITLDAGATLVLGKSELPEKVQRFLLVYDEHLVSQFEAVARVDMRYANGLAVAWSEEYEVRVEEAG